MNFSSRAVPIIAKKEVMVKKLERESKEGRGKGGRERKEKNKEGRKEMNGRMKGRKKEKAVNFICLFTSHLQDSNSFLSKISLALKELYSSIDQ